MNETFYQFLSIDFSAMFTAVFASISCALLGNFLLLKRQSLMGDAISHAVLPGIILAFLFTGGRAEFSVFLGAAGAAVLSAVLIELVRVYGRMDANSAMGVVFSIMFAGGILLMEQAAARNVDLDADCLLYGQLETIFWYPPHTLAELFRFATLQDLPHELITSLSVALITILFLFVFFKELKISTFDPALSTSLGYNATFLHLVLMVLVAGAVVASFKAVGSILVIAMIICPPAIARLLTDSLPRQIYLSAIFAFLSSTCGYAFATLIPTWFGYEQSVNSAGMMAVVSGLMLVVAVFVAPRYGIIGRSIRSQLLKLLVAREDILGFLYRYQEITYGEKIPALPFREIFVAIGNTWMTRIAVRDLLRKNLVTKIDACLSLTRNGEVHARSLVRTHRLWESYLVRQAGLRPDHVHPSAETFEHFTSKKVQEELARKGGYPHVDPHGKEIPGEEGCQNYNLSTPFGITSTGHVAN